MPISQELQDKIQQLPSLPTLPEIASKLIRMVNNPDTSAREVASLVGQDLSLSAKLLRLANSAFYGMPKKISNINTAIVILGFRVISTLVLSLTVFDIFPQDRKSGLFDRKAFWYHSLSSALISKFIADRVRIFPVIEPEEAFCAGLLHDIGKVVMEQYLHEDFHEALKQARYGKKPVFETEHAVLGYTHVDVAEWLTTHWDLPPRLRTGIIFHHQPLSATGDPGLAALCHYADYLFYDMKLTGDSGYELPKLERESVESLCVSPNIIDELKGSIAEELERASAFFEAAGA